MLAVIPARTDPTRPLIPQAFQNLFYQFPSIERFVVGLSRRDGAEVSKVGVLGLTVWSGAILGGGLPTAMIALLAVAGGALGLLLALAKG